MNDNIKQLLWYIAGSTTLFILTCFIPASTEEMGRLYISFLLITAGLLLGLVLKKQFSKMPWLLFFIPLLQMIIIFFLLAM